MNFMETEGEFNGDVNVFNLYAEGMGKVLTNEDAKPNLPGWPYGTATFRVSDEAAQTQQMAQPQQRQIPYGMQGQMQQQMMMAYPQQAMQGYGGQGQYTMMPAQYMQAQGQPYMPAQGQQQPQQQPGGAQPRPMMPPTQMPAGQAHPG